MYGAGGYGMNGMNGMPGQPGQDPSLTQSFNQSTAATFQIIESIVGAFGGFAQMLESTYMATHSSFFGMCKRTKRHELITNRSQQWSLSQNNSEIYEIPSAPSLGYSLSSAGYAH